MAAFEEMREKVNIGRNFVSLQLRSSEYVVEQRNRGCNMFNYLLFVLDEGFLEDSIETLVQGFQIHGPLDLGEDVVRIIVRYLICFSAETNDVHEHATNWVCLDDEEYWKGLDWVAADHTMNLGERTGAFTITTYMTDGTAVQNKFRTFCRVELGEKLH